MSDTTWTAEGWEADFFAGFLVLTDPNGECRAMQLKSNGRLNTLNEFRSSVKTHGVLKACQVFWKLAA